MPLTSSRNPEPRIYEESEHSIRLADIDPDALKIMRRLHACGYEAYVVGGAIRDLLLGRHPKDFDVVTNALPRKIRSLFRNSREIGKRFRLVHIFFKGNKIIETATFRSQDSEGYLNVYGSMIEDIARRDFTMNALLYNPQNRTIIDYVNGVRDIRDRRLRPLIPIDRIFREDPVRMIRALKYASTGDLTIETRLRRHLRRSATLIADCATSRLTEELLKILISGAAHRIFSELMRYRLLSHIQPKLHSMIAGRANRQRCQQFLQSMLELDQLLSEGRDIKRALSISYYIRDAFTWLNDANEEGPFGFDRAFSEIKGFLYPTTPPNFEVERALQYLIQGRRSIPKRRRGMRTTDAGANSNRRRRRSPKRAERVTEGD